MTRFTDGRVPDEGIRELFEPPHRWGRWLEVEAALAGAEADHGVVPAQAAHAIAAAASWDAVDIKRVRAGIARTSHPLMALVTELAAAAGQHGGWVHWGATTQNITQTGDALVLREVLDVVVALLRRALAAMADLAEAGADMVMAGRTHGQHAVPITFGLKAAGWIEETTRHLTRIAQLRPRVEVAMAGGAVGSFASLGPVGPAVQASLADRLGLVPMTVPSRATGDGAAELVCVLGLVAGTGGRIAGQVYALMTTEVGEAAEPAPPGTVGSSTMPHKHNPQLCDDVLAIGAQVRAQVPVALEAALHDHEVDGAHSAMADDAQQTACVLTGDLLARLVVVLEGLELHPARMRANLELSGGLTSSEQVMLALGEHVGRQRAHHVVTEAVAAAADGGVSFAQALAADPCVTGHLDSAALAALLDPAARTGSSAQLAREAASRARELLRAGP